MKGSTKKKRSVRYVFEFDANAAIMSGGQGLRPHKVLREDEHRHAGDALFDKFRESGALLLRMEELMPLRREKTFSLDVRVDSQRFGMAKDAPYKINLYEICGGSRRYLCSGEEVPNPEDS